MKEKRVCADLNKEIDENVAECMDESTDLERWRKLKDNIIKSDHIIIGAEAMIPTRKNPG